VSEGLILQAPDILKQRNPYKSKETKNQGKSMATKINLTRLLESSTRVRRINQEDKDNTSAISEIINHESTSSDRAYSFELEKGANPEAPNKADGDLKLKCCGRTNQDLSFPEEIRERGIERRLKG